MMFWKLKKENKTGFITLIIYSLGLSVFQCIKNEIKSTELKWQFNKIK